MCGFVGYVGPPAPTPLLEASRDLLRHRGPDGAGLWQNPDHTVGLGFRRLRILDPSPAADQPMSRDGLHLVYNGEVYNFRDLRRELEGKGHAFRSSGDTEVVLAAYREWGLDAIERLEGMFALAIWDEDTQRLVLARDRAGIKPLYHAVHDGRFVFASEPKAVLALAEKPAELDETALAQFLTFLWVPDPNTLFRGVRKLPPGHVAVYEGHQLTSEQYWDLTFEPEQKPLREHAEQLIEAIREATRKQLVSDVPLGVFLSGGLDSTLLTRLAAEQTSHPLLAIAAGAADERDQLREPGVPDLPYARRAAEAIPNLDYREVSLEGSTSDAVTGLVEGMDDPVADPAAVSTHLICRAAAPHATVMLSGVGAEELFAGYPRHRAVGAAAKLAPLPHVVRRPFGWAAKAVPGATNGRARHIKKLLEGLAEPDPYVGFVAHHTQHTLSRLAGSRIDWSTVTAEHRAHLDKAKTLPPLSRALYLDFKTFLPCLNLAYTDRASMANSVEVRVPLLDEAVVARAARIPEGLKRDGATGKVVLKEAARGFVPQEILERPKSGFGAPVRSWMAREAGEVVRDCLSEDTLRRRGLADAGTVREMQDALRAGRRDESLQLWALVVLELWARRFLDRTPVARTA